MIAVVDPKSDKYDAKKDYAVMKHLQQLKLKFPNMSVTSLGRGEVSFSELGKGETLFVVGHGNSSDRGNFRDIDFNDVSNWLTNETDGLPPDFSGAIVLLSCFSGISFEERNTLAEDLAKNIREKEIAPKATVAGAVGYSFGTPEYQQSERSSVLPLSLGGFYLAKDTKLMASQWLKHKPTHAEGVLRQKIDNVDLNKTIEENLQSNPQLNAEQAAKDLVNAFTGPCNSIVLDLKKVIDKISEKTIQAQVEYLLDVNKDGVETWNTKVREQYELHRDYYLWPPVETAFQVVPVGGN